MLRRFVSTMAVVLVLAFLAGCLGGGGEKRNVFDENEQTTIKVMFYDENSFFQQFGSLFISKFPNVDVEVVNVNALYGKGKYDEASFLKFIEDNQPDVLLLNASQYEKLSSGGKLYALDSLIEQDKYDIEGIHPGILQQLREKGGGKLYGLGPTFSSRALFYNADLFHLYGVELPRDSMSWEEVLELAKRFPAEGGENERVYGYSPETTGLYTPIDLANTIAETENLRYLTPDGSRTTLSGEAWRSVLETAASAVQSGAVYMPQAQSSEGSYTMQVYYSQDLFIAGRSAMTVRNSYFIQNVSDSQNYLDKAPLNWGIVTAPVNPNDRARSNDIRLNSIFAIRADTPNARAAWEFLKYISGEEFARVKSKAPLSGELLSRTAYNREQDGRSMEPFYKLEPGTSPTSLLENAPPSFYGLLYPIVNEELGSVVENKKPFDEAYRNIQARAESALQEAKKREEAEKSAEPNA